MEALPAFRPGSPPSRLLTKNLVDAAVVADWWLQSAPDAVDHLDADLDNNQGTPANTHAIPVELGKPVLARLTRGLPRHDNLCKLAAVFTETQCRLWPELVDAQVLRPGTPEVIRALALNFATRFISKQIELFDTSPEIGQLWTGLGISYLRYSSGQQNPRSLDDQLVLQLAFARKDRIFIPWNYVFGDAGVTGRVANRIGYNLAKDAMSISGKGAVQVIFVDEIARATRDGLETLMLGDMVQRLGKRMVGVSDGFDTREEFSRMKLHFFAMFNEQFLTQHRQKVVRGKDGAARRGTILGRVPFGYKKVVANDASGQPMRVRRGTVAHAMAIDGSQLPLIQRLPEMFVDQRKSLRAMAVELNQMAAGGKRCWTPGRVKGVLTNHLYAGIVIRHRVKHVKNPNSGMTKLVQNPRSQWMVKRCPKLRIWSWKTWKRIRARLKEIGRIHRKGSEHLSRGQLYPTTLFSGSLFCGYCGAELKLFRSGKERMQFWCRNGHESKHQCLLNHSKSARVIEKCILAYIRDHLLTPERINEVIGRANKELEKEAARPKVEVAPLRATLDELKSRRNRLIDLVAGSLSPDLAAVRQRILKAEQDIRELSGRISDAERSNSSRPRSIGVREVLPLLGDLRLLLNQDIALVAPVIRSLLGPISMTLGPPGMRVKHRQRAWIASFRPRLLETIVEIACDSPHCPDPSLWVNLKVRKWTFPENVQLPIDEYPLYRTHAAEVRRLKQSGLTIAEISRRLGLPFMTVHNAYMFSLDGMHVRQRRLVKPSRSAS